MNHDEMASLEAMLLGRAYLYALFHKAFGGEPTKELVAEMSSAQTVEVLDEYAEADDTLAKVRDFLALLDGKADDERFMWDCEAEYTRMFVGPGMPAAIPWESPYISDEPVMLQEETLVVRSIYRSFGFEAKRLYHVPDDHISLMCHFMMQRAEESISAFREARWTDLRELMLGQCAFVRDHMASWLPRYASKACSGKTVHLYPQLAKGVAAFADLDKTFAAEAVAWVDALDEGAGFPEDYERPVSFAQVEEAYERLKAVRLFGLEDNELCKI